MKGAARMTNEASPTPTSILQNRRLQKPQDSPQAKTDKNHISRPIPTSLNGSTVALKWTKTGADTSRPAMNAAGRQPSSKFDRSNAPCKQIEVIVVSRAVEALARLNSMHDDAWYENRMSSDGRVHHT